MNKKQYAVILICSIIFAFLGGIFSQGIFPGENLIAQEPETTKKISGIGIQDYLSKESLFIGIVQSGKLQLLAPQPSSPLAVTTRLTGIAMQEARSPESAEINLAKYEGKTVMVHGHDSGGWIYKAAIVDSGGPLVTALIIDVFGKPLGE
jgi:hypothetical protein